MKRFILTGVLCLAAWVAFAQKVNKINLQRSEKVIGLPESGLLRVIKPTFAQEGSTLSADSAIFNQAANTFDAFGNIVITQSDGTRVYSDLLNYNGNTQLALLTRNVRMVDKDAVLTTNFLTYNMANKVGTYTGGGKIVNGKNVLTSKNGYYYANTRDAFFRYNVNLKTPDALIKSDTLRYNSGSKIAFFYGPTNIYGKDSTVLYTENGQHNTVNEQSRFGRKNLFTQGSKSLKGDSLYYDGKTDRGRAVRNITFIDTAQKFTLKGNRGIYKKADESILVTDNAYVIVTTEKDSAQVDSIWMAADTLFSKMVLKSSVDTIGQIKVKKDTELEDPKISQNMAPGNEDDAEAAGLGGNTGADSVRAAGKLVGEGDSLKKGVADTLKGKPAAAIKTPAPVKPDSVQTAAKPPPKTQVDSLKKQQLAQQDTSSRDAAKADTIAADSLEDKGIAAKTDTVKKGPPKSKRQLKREQRRLAKAEKRETRKLAADSARAARVQKRQGKVPDSLQLVAAKDSLKMKAPPDTAKTRIVRAYNNAKIFKSDLQARADSLFFSYADSTIRCYVNPMMWTQGSQMSADTIYMQLKNKKLDNMLLQHDGFIVNTEKDSVKFNQVKGKVITGYFKDSKLQRMFVDGNAESLYYTKEDSAYSGVNKTISGRIKIVFKDNEISDIIPIRKATGQYFPIEQVTDDNGILEGFIWKPKDRPRSKEEVIRSVAASKKTLAGKPTPKPGSKKTAAKKVVGKPAAKPIVKNVSAIKTGGVKTGAVSTKAAPAKTTSTIKAGAGTDSLSLKTASKTDSVKKKLSDTTATQKPAKPANKTPAKPDSGKIQLKPAPLKKQVAVKKVAMQQ